MGIPVCNLEGRSLWFGDPEMLKLLISTVEHFWPRARLRCQDSVARVGRGPWMRWARMESIPLVDAGTREESPGAEVCHALENDLMEVQPRPS